MEMSLKRKNNILNLGLDKQIFFQVKDLQIQTNERKEGNIFVFLAFIK